MDKLIKGLGRAILALAILFFTAVIGGTLIYWFWPVAIPAFLPGLVKEGILPAYPSWWASVTFSWVMGLLFRPYGNSVNRDK